MKYSALLIPLLLIEREGFAMTSSLSSREEINKD